MEQVREGVLGDGLEGNLWEEGLPLCVQSRFECLHRRSVRNLLWQSVPIRDYPNVERMLAATGFTPLLMTLKSMTSKPKTVSHGKSTRPCIISYIHRWLPRIRLRTKEKSHSRWRAASYWTWRSLFMNFTASS